MNCLILNTLAAIREICSQSFCSHLRYEIRTILLWMVGEAILFYGKNLGARLETSMETAMQLVVLLVALQSIILYKLRTKINHTLLQQLEISSKVLHNPGTIGSKMGSRQPVAWLANRNLFPKPLIGDLRS